MNDKYYAIYVPNEGPVDAKIMFVGEAPGETENQQRRPFVGESGNLFTNVLNRNGVARGEVYLGNLCNHRPAYGNKFELLLSTDVLKEGLKSLYAHIEKHRPTVICALGAWPLSFLTGKKGIKKWRGSILEYINDPTIKVIPTVHPAAVLRDRGLYPIFDQDIKRVIGDSAFPERRLTERRFIIDPRGMECEEWVQRLCASEFLGSDIETVKNSTKILCMGFAPSPHLAVCFLPGSPEGRRAIERVLLSDARKIFQLGTYDTIQLLNNNGYELKDPRAEELDRPYWWDTLVAQHVLAPELPRSLEYLTSIYTREPYYKTVGRGSIPDDEKGWNEKTVNRQSLYEYNCRDCCCTIETALQQMEELASEPIATQNIFDFEMEMVGASRDISTAGLPIDDDRRAVIEKVLLKKWGTKQFALDRLVGYTCNVRSPKLKVILYEKLDLPTKRKRDGAITTDEDAIVSLITHCKDKIASYKTAEKRMEWTVKLVVCQTILEIRGIRQVLSNYILSRQRNGRPRASSDGRIRSMYRIGPETGRWSASKYVDGTGFNAQTLPRDPVEIPESELTNAPVDVKLLEQLDTEPDEDVVEEEAEVAA